MIKFLTEIPDYGSQLEDFVEGYYRMQIIKGYTPLIIAAAVIVAAIFLTRYAIKQFAKEKAKYIDYDEIVKRTADEVSRRFRSGMQ